MTSRGLRTAGTAAVPYWANGGSGSDVGRAEEPGGYALTSVCAHLADIPSDSQKMGISSQGRTIGGRCKGRPLVEAAGAGEAANDCRAGHSLEAVTPPL